VPLTPSTDPNRAAHRTRVLAVAYGAGQDERRDLLGARRPARSGGAEQPAVGSPVPFGRS